MDYNYEYLEDVATADIAFKAEGENLNHLFETAGIATAATMMDLGTIKHKIVKEISLKMDDLEQMLHAFLEEIIYLKDAELLFFSKFEVRIVGSTLNAKMFGDKLNKKMIFKNDIKAITMHMLQIEKKNDKYYATVVVDI